MSGGKADIPGSFRLSGINEKKFCMTSRYYHTWRVIL